MSFSGVCPVARQSSAISKPLARRVVRLNALRGVVLAGLVLPLLAGLPLAAQTVTFDPVLVTATVTVGNQPVGVAVNPAGTFAYVANNSDSTVSVINLATNTVTATIPVGSSPFGVAVNSDGTFAYVTDESGNAVSVIALAKENFGPEAVGSTTAS